MIEYLPWDSSFFNFKTGMSVINEAGDVDLIRENFNKSDYQLLYLFDYNANNLIVQLLKKSKILLIDTKVTYSKSNLSHTSNNKGTLIDELSDELIDLGLQSGIYSRFYRDERLQKFFKPMYTRWVEKSISGEMADAVIGIYNDTQLCGMITIKAADDKAQIGLIAVDSRYRGVGIGKQLLQAAENWCIDNQIAELNIATQLINVEACNFYKKNKFNLTNSVHIFHLWK